MKGNAFDLPFLTNIPTYCFSTNFYFLIKLNFLQSYFQDILRNF